MDLSDWQERLESHFRALRTRRNVEVGDQPSFALEHGLDEPEVNALDECVRAHVREEAPSWKHHLVWTVYATELGYLYSGDEYWQTFEERTPGWREHGDRYWMRSCFREFQEQYGGAEPTGTWARHFSIICWPITHSILPKDLQRQLAKLLYELRHVISSNILSSYRRLGELIAAHSWGTSSRFQQLAQEPLLIGQIAAALLLQGEQDTSLLILPSTLQRIGEDLNRERVARVWMRGARDSARHQIQISGGSVPGGTLPRDNRPDDEGSREAPRLGLEPRLLLRPCADDKHDWDVLLELPDFSHIPLRYPEFRATLGSSRCWVTGSSGRPLARGRLLYGPQRVLLRLWPSDDECLLEFERPNPELDYLLKAECLLRPGPAWLFRVAADGLAYELRGKHVRAGQRYVIASECVPEIDTHATIQLARLNCEGVIAVFLDLPESISPDLEEILIDLGLPLAGIIRVWPAGLIPGRWDGEGGVEWLRTETPCVGLQADHYVEGFVAELGGQTIEVKPSNEGTPVFIELPRLPIGQHTLRVSACGPGGEFVDEPAVLDIQIREPRVWRPESGGQGALLVIVEPQAPTLEQLWEMDVGIEVHGPRGRQVGCMLRLYEKGDTKPCLQKSLPEMRLPVTVDDWQTRLIRLKEDIKVQNAYDLAYSGDVKFTAGELGAFTLTVEREFSPLRWALHRAKAGYFLHIIDDTGGESEAEVRFFAFDTPETARTIDARDCYAKQGAAAEGGLHVVTASGHERAIVIPAAVKTLSDLRVDPQLRPRDRRPEDLMELIRMADLWASAGLTGNILSQAMRRQVLQSMLHELFSLICGQHWANVERRVAKGGAQVIRVAKQAIFLKPQEAEMAAVMLRDVADLAASTPNDRVTRLAHHAKRFLSLRPKGRRRAQVVSSSRRSEVAVVRWRAEGPDDPRWLTEFTLRLASWPTGIIDWAGSHAQRGLTHLITVPGLARMARFMVFAVNSEKASSEVAASLLNEGWGWS